LTSPFKKQNFFACAVPALATHTRGRFKKSFDLMMGLIDSTAETFKNAFIYCLVLVLKLENNELFKTPNPSSPTPTHHQNPNAIS
jgi:hypothetical protein